MRERSYLVLVECVPLVLWLDPMHMLVLRKVIHAGRVVVLTLVVEQVKRRMRQVHLLVIEGKVTLGGAVKPS